MEMHILDSFLEIMFYYYLLKHLPSSYIIPPSDTTCTQIFSKS